MSRRSRRSKSNGGGNKLGIIAVILMVILVVGVGVVHTMIRKYLHSDEFRQMLSSKVNEVAHVDGKFAPFRWDGLAVDTDTYQATSDGLIRELNVEGLHTEIGLGEIWSGIWQIQGSRVRKIEVVLDTQAPKAPPKAAPRRAASEKPPW